MSRSRDIPRGGLKMECKYEEMKKAKRRAKRIFRKMKYRGIKPPLKCCLTCEHSYQSYIESSLECLLVSNEIMGWSFADIEELCVCDNWEKKKED